MIVRVHPKNPEVNKIKSIVGALKRGNILIIPTDGVYALACDLNNKKGVERICLIKGIKPSKANFSILCDGLSNLSDFTLNISKHIFKVLKRNLPGPFTFIFCYIPHTLRIKTSLIATLYFFLFRFPCFIS